MLRFISGYLITSYSGEQIGQNLFLDKEGHFLLEDIDDNGSTTDYVGESVVGSIIRRHFEYNEEYPSPLDPARKKG